MNTWKVIVATLVIFIAGVVTGGLLAVYSGRSFVVRPQRPAPPNRPAPTQSPGILRVEFLRRLQRELDLTAGQRERIDQILKESQEHIRKIEEPVLPAVRDEMRRTREAFRDELTPEQRVKFDESFKHPSHSKHSAGTNASSSVLSNQSSIISGKSDY